MLRAKYLLPYLCVTSLGDLLKDGSINYKIQLKSPDSFHGKAQFITLQTTQLPNGKLQNYKLQHYKLQNLQVTTIKATKLQVTTLQDTKLHITTLKATKLQVTTFQFIVKQVLLRRRTFFMHSNIKITCTVIYFTNL